MIRIIKELIKKKISKNEKRASYKFTRDADSLLLILLLMNTSWSFWASVRSWRVTLSRVIEVCNKLVLMMVDTLYTLRFRVSYPIGRRYSWKSWTSRFDCLRLRERSRTSGPRCISFYPLVSLSNVLWACGNSYY